MIDQKKEKILTVRGVVTEALPSTLFRVRIPVRDSLRGNADVLGSASDNGVAGDAGVKDILAYLGGKMRMHRIKVLIGDTVEVILDSYGGKGRIVKRL